MEIRFMVISISQYNWAYDTQNYNIYHRLVSLNTTLHGSILKGASVALALRKSQGYHTITPMIYNARIKWWRCMMFILIITEIYYFKYYQWETVTWISLRKATFVWL
jgi:hypothetical protein